jgi:hypothetical protein
MVSRLVQPNRKGHFLGCGRKKKEAERMQTEKRTSGKNGLRRINLVPFLSVVRKLDPYTMFSDLWHTGNAEININKKKTIDINAGKETLTSQSSESVSVL